MHVHVHLDRYRLASFLGSHGGRADATGSCKKSVDHEYCFVSISVSISIVPGLPLRPIACM